MANYKTQKIEGRTANAQSYVEIDVYKHVTQQAKRLKVSAASIWGGWINEGYKRDSKDWPRLKK